MIDNYEGSIGKKVFYKSNIYIYIYIDCILITTYVYVYE